MYINFWYPVCKTGELTPDAPRRVELLGLNFVAFRDDGGAAHVLSDTCVHRGGALGLGQLVDGRVQCPYHGWQFGGDGRCVHIPSLPDTTPPARAKVDSYPVEERYGVVFAFLGDLPADERPPVCPVPEYGQDGWRASEIVVLDIDCYYERSMENGLDPAHNEFVHPRQGFPPMLEDTFEMQDDPWGARFWADFGDPVLELTEFAKDRNRTGELRAGSWFHGPNGLVTSIFVNRDSNLVQYFFEAPVNDSHTRIYFLNMRNWLLEPDKDERIMQTNLRIVKEDIGILEALWPVRTPPTLTREIMTPSDQVVVRFREQLAQWQSRGWQIDRHAMHDKHGDVAYAIPCPDRRASGNWVLDPVPLLAPEN
ncbi:MAG: aromatic ring-hydroxylating dioxygenase subunit alpha [Chromatiales bacterium]|nr:MAG: aromatic ring-hydroxylating dioxygenase subunit alpha [Chromatiales bacterium]